MTIPDEIIQLVKIRLTKGVPKVNITNDLNISLRTVQTISSGHRELQGGSKCRQRISKTELQVRNAVQVINKDGQRVTAKKVCDLLTLETSPTTVRRRLKCMGYWNPSVAEKIMD